MVRQAIAGLYFYSMSSELTRIFFHVGLGKTASKFLQHKIFPKLKGIHYIKPAAYHRYREEIERTSAEQILISREFDNQLESETEKFAFFYPHSKTIIVLRRHDSWLASQYRRHLKNGLSCSFEEFIDIVHDSGKWRRDKVFFYPKLLHLEKRFGSKPLVLFQEDLRSNPKKFIQNITRFVGACFDENEVSFRPHHTSYREKQLKVMRKVGKYLFNQREKAYSGNRAIAWLQKRAQLFGSYIVLYTSLLIPDFLVSNEKLIPQEALEKVRNFYADDWERCRQYANSQN